MKRLIPAFILAAFTSTLIAQTLPVSNDWGTVSIAGQDAVSIRIDNVPANRTIKFPRLFNPIGDITHEGKAVKGLKFKPLVEDWAMTLPPGMEKTTLQLVTLGSPLLPVTPPVVQELSAGGFDLPAHLAMPYGEMLRYEPQPHKNTIGYWVNEKDYADWLVQVKTPGTFHVEILQGCGTGQGGSEVAVSIIKGKKILSSAPFIVQDTGHFQNFKWRRIGKVQIDKESIHTVRIHALKKAKNAVMDVRKIRLVPAPEVVRVWPRKAPGEPFDSLDPKVLKDKISQNVSHRIFGIEHPTFTLYLPEKEKANGTCVVVCPGGGYNILALAKEGTEVAHWLNDLGVAAAVLEYRVPRRSKEGFHIPPLQDAQRTIRLVRKNAKAWGIDPDRVGALGFSAGGHLTIMTATHWDEQTYKPIDAADKLSARPDFVLPIYPAYLGYDAGEQALTSLVKLTDKTPPAFIAVTWDDKMRGADSALVLEGLKKHNVPAELHIFSKGGHGYGLRPGKSYATGWNHLATTWLKQQGLLEKQ